MTLDQEIRAQTQLVSEPLPKNWGEAIAAAPNPFAIAASRYIRAPVAFVREVLGAQPDPWQLEALRALAKGHTRLAIRSGHGVGKSCLAAWVICWFANTRAPARVSSTACTNKASRSWA
jgi:hypothetical protein